ncbi:uncharacterized protein PFB0765w [Pseudomyrmex gracilis]|uniref:uncharacterized protein PFB0765w n=1 Tax=Pseudomyrmex gracilis TaxID=219809 RepID=UPI000994CE84|nr:uncharacterized protein PFB0765w [Pseudomyrmex gracilis]
MLKTISDSRKQQLEELKNFTDAVNKEVADTVRTLGWTVESVTNVDKEYFTCPYNSSHRITEQFFNDHLILCQWKAENYDKSSLPLSEPTLSVESPFTIKFDEQLQSHILKEAKEQNPIMQTGTGERLIPRTSDRLITDFTSDERRALYDYVISNTKKPEIGRDIEDINNLKLHQKDDKKVSYLELMLQERNLKRRRAKHRGVHTNKKSQVEILREVINQQMEVYVDYISEQNSSQHATNIQTTKREDFNLDTMSDKTKYLRKALFFTSPQNYDDFDFREEDTHRYSKIDDLKQNRSEEKNYHRSRDRVRRERHSDETYKNHRNREHKTSSHSKDQKAHKKDKHRSKDIYKDKHHEKKHKSRNCDRSSERHHSKHRDHKRKNKEY